MTHEAISRRRTTRKCEMELVLSTQCKLRSSGLMCCASMISSIARQNLFHFRSFLHILTVYGLFICDICQFRNIALFNIRPRSPNNYYVRSQHHRLRGNTEGVAIRRRSNSAVVRRLSVVPLLFLEKCNVARKRKGRRGEDRGGCNLLLLSPPGLADGADREGRWMD